MAAYCNRCERYVNQYCDTCGGNAGIAFCDMYACGGKMLCPICGKSDLVPRQGLASQAEGAESKMAGTGTARKMPPGAVMGGERMQVRLPRGEGRDNHCPICDYVIDLTWKYCPECGVRFSTMELPERGDG